MENDLSERKVGLLTRYLNRRRDERNLLMTAGLLGVAANLASRVFDFLPNWTAILVAAAMFAAVFGILIFERYSRGTDSNRIVGTMILDSRLRVPIPVEGYQFSISVQSCYEYGIQQLPLLRARWQAGYLGSDRRQLVRGGDEAQPSPAEIARQMTEYFVLDFLSTHVEDYFTVQGIDERELTQVDIANIPNGLLDSNQFLSLFSDSDWTDQELDDPLLRDNYPSAILMSGRSSRRLYQRFNLFLPKGTTVAYFESGELVLSNRVMDVSIRAEFNGFGANVDKEFLGEYIGVRSHSYLNIEAWQAEVCIETRIKPSALIMFRGWKYQTWVESFIAELRKSMELEEFQKQISWPAVRTLIIAESREPQFDYSSVESLLRNYDPLVPSGNYAASIVRVKGDVSDPTEDSWFEDRFQLDDPLMKVASRFIARNLVYAYQEGDPWSGQELQRMYRTNPDDYFLWFLALSMDVDDLVPDFDRVDDWEEEFLADCWIMLQEPELDGARGWNR